MTEIRINRDRLWQTLMRLKEIGGYDDASTGLRGVRRLALTDQDAEARRLVVSKDAGQRHRCPRQRHPPSRRGDLTGLAFRAPAILACFWPCPERNWRQL